MVVYIVIQCCDHYDYGCTENIGVFPTVEEAEKFLQKYKKEVVNGDFHPELDIEQWEIGETVLDTL
jgi:hypothetical protein